jgi:hypothetical protein
MRIIPWVAAFLFGCVVFVVGKVFQRAERKRAEERKAENERKTLLTIVEQMKTHEEEPGGIMAAIRGEERQHTGRPFN